MEEQRSTLNFHLNISRHAPEAERFLDTKLILEGGIDGSRSPARLLRRSKGGGGAGEEGKDGGGLHLARRLGLL